MKRRRELVVSGDVYSEAVRVCYNDRDPIGLANAQEYEAFRKRLAAEGWTKDSEEAGREEWCARYSVWVEAEAQPEGMCNLVRMEKGARNGSVAASGEWAAFGAAGVELVRSGVERVRLAVRSKESPVVAMEGGRLVVGLAGLGIVEAYEMAGAGWTKTAEIAVDKGLCEKGFGAKVALHGDTMAAAGQMRGRPVTYVFAREGGEWRMAARIPGPVAGLALHGNWLLLAAKGGVQAYRRADGAWTFHSSFGNADFCSMAIHAGRLAVYSMNPGMVYLYRFGGERWELESSIDVQDNSNDHPLVLGDGMLAAGDPGRFGGSGGVDVLVEREGKWVLEETIVLADRRMGDRFGRGLALTGNELTVCGDAGFWVYSCLQAS